MDKLLEVLLDSVYFLFFIGGVVAIFGFPIEFFVYLYHNLAILELGPTISMIYALVSTMICILVGLFLVMFAYAVDEFR